MTLTRLPPTFLAEYLAAIDAHPFASLLVAVTLVVCIALWKRPTRSPKS